MKNRGEGSDFVDNLLKFVAFSGVISVALVAPNAVQAFDKPFSKFLKKMDDRQRQRRVHASLRYMKYQGLIEGDYQHGLQITKKGRKRLEKIEIDEVKIPKPKKWDGKWRVVMFDISEKYKSGRDALTKKLKELGFYQLQKSVNLHPFPCREEIEKIANAYGIDQFVTYLETSHIDKDKLLKKHFKL